MKQSREGQACRHRLLREGGRGEPSPRDSGREWGPETAPHVEHRTLPGGDLGSSEPACPVWSNFRRWPGLLWPLPAPSLFSRESGPAGLCLSSAPGHRARSRTRRAFPRPGTVQAAFLRAPSSPACSEPQARGPRGEWDHGHAHMHSRTPVPAPRLRAAGLSRAPCAHVGVSACRFSVRGL